MNEMTLSLPNYDELLFEDSPLEEVICQVRFSPILKIASENPAQFQDKIRVHFPLLQKEGGVRFGLSAGDPIVATTIEPTWQFKSTDDKWMVSLTTTFVAIRTTDYLDFPDFSKRTLEVLRAFEETYQPQFYLRVGLRYINRFTETDAHWERMLNPLIAGAITDPVIGNAVTNANHHVILNAERGQIGFRYSRTIGKADGKPAEQFTLDFDHFLTGQVACPEVPDMLVSFNSNIYRLFRWCLTPAGTNSLRPKRKEATV